MANGKPGRPGWKDTLQYKKVGELCRTILIRGFESDEIPELEKFKIAAQVYNKLVPQNLNITADGQLLIKAVQFAQLKGGNQDPPIIEVKPDGNSDPGSEEIQAA